MKLKAFLFTLLMVALTAVSCNASDRYTQDINVLPAAAKTMLSANFSSSQVSTIKIDSHLFGADDYEVLLADGTEIDFDSEGNIEEVDCSRSGKVPDAIIPQSIKDYVARTYPNQNIVKYDVKRNGYEVELQSGLDLSFNQSGSFLRVDD